MAHVGSVQIPRAGDRTIRTRPLVLSLVGVALLAGAARAQHFPAGPALEALIRERVEEGRATGIVLGVLEADGSTRVVSFGDPGPDRPPLDDGTVFEIGSITKAFTGVLLAEMTARGEVSLDDPVQKHLPEHVRVPSRGGRPITLLDLATHHSGLPRLPDNFAPADPSNPYADYTVEQLYAFLSSHELRRDIGAEYEYSNLAVGLLGHALTLAASASDYGALVRERILNPLGMTASGIALTPGMRARMAAGHDQAGNVVPLWDLPTLAGAGALRSDATDMLRFLAANVGEPATPLERAMRMSHAERKALGAAGAVGLNWHVRKSATSTIVWHNGGTAGFRTFAGFDPAKEVGVVVLTNSAHGADDIGFHLIDPEIPLTPAPIERVAIQLDPAVLAEYVGTYEMTPEFRIEITSDGGQLYAQATGQARFPIYAEAEDAFFLRVVEAQLTFERGDDGAVSGLVLHQGGARQPARKIR